MSVYTIRRADNETLLMEVRTELRGVMHAVILDDCRGMARVVSLSEFPYVAETAARDIYLALKLVAAESYADAITDIRRYGDPLGS